MNRKAAIWVAVIAVIVLVGGGIVLLANRSSNKNNSSTNGASNNQNMNGMNMNNTPAQNQNQSQNNGQSTAANAVTIQNFAFNSADITVKKGTTVTWTNRDSTAHTVTENDGQSGPNSGLISPGADYSFTYSTVGTFKYRCSIHPSMMGSVAVTE